jgi:hypothetical protein
MSNTVKSVEGQSSWSSEPSRPLDLGVWNAWLLKNRGEEHRGATARIRVALLVGVLLAVAVTLFLLLHPSPVADVQPVVGALTGAPIQGGRPWVSA